MTALMGIDARLRMARLVVIVDARQVRTDLRDFVLAVSQGGAELIQLRLGGMDRRAQLETIETARAIGFQRQRLIVVDADPDLAGAAKADVLHLAADGPETVKARKPLHEWAQLGRTCYDEGQLRAALADPGLDYCWVAPATGKGLDLVRAATAAAKPGDPAAKPWFAVGGVSLETLDDVLAAGARRVGVGTAIAMADDPRAATQAIHDRLQQAWDADPVMSKYVFSVFNRPVLDAPFGDGK